MFLKISRALARSDRVAVLPDSAPVCTRERSGADVRQGGADEADAVMAMRFQARLSLIIEGLHSRAPVFVYHMVRDMRTPLENGLLTAATDRSAARVDPCRVTDRNEVVAKRPGCSGSPQESVAAVGRKPRRLGAGCGRSRSLGVDDPRDSPRRVRACSAGRAPPARGAIARSAGASAWRVVDGSLRPLPIAPCLLAGRWTRVACGVPTLA